MIDIQITVDEAGRLSWRASTGDLSQVHWWLSIAKKSVLDQATEQRLTLATPDLRLGVKAS